MAGDISAVDKVEPQSLTLNANKEQSCYFLDKLPQELRNAVYADLLSCDKPLRRPRGSFNSGILLSNTSILFVNKQVHQEALNVFYDVNTVQFSRRALCDKRHRWTTAPLFKQQLVRNLQLNSFRRAGSCLIHPCLTCKASACGLFQKLASCPRLRNVTIDYSRASAPARIAMDAFTNGLAESDVGLRLPCVDIGQYTLCGAWFPRTHIRFVSKVLVETWPIACTLPLAILEHPWALRRTQIPFPTFSQEHKCTVRLLIMLARQEWGGYVLQTIAAAWPQGEAKELRRAGPAFGAAFLHNFTKALEDAKLEVRYSLGWDHYIFWHTT